MLSFKEQFAVKNDQQTGRGSDQFNQTNPVTESAAD